MEFGDYIKEKRDAIGWNQPEAALKASIEQSYLSKLETGKSYPSEEVFSRLVKAYGFDPVDMCKHVFSAELDKLRDIKQVRETILNRQKHEHGFVRTWLIAGLCSLLIGGALLGLSQVLPEQTIPQFRYKSMGVLFPGESLDVFDIIVETINNNGINAEEQIQKQQEMIDRLDEVYVVFTEYRDANYIEKVEGGRRFWILFNGGSIVEISPLRWLLIPAFMFLFGGIGSLVVGYRWRS